MMKSTVLKFNGVLKASNQGSGILADAKRLTCGSGKQEGGVFEKYGTADQAQYFRREDQKLLKKLKDQMKEQLEFHEKQVALHKEALEKMKKSK